LSIRGPRTLRAVALAVALTPLGPGAAASQGPPFAKPPRDVPYVPTPASAVERMIELAGVKSGDVLYDLGCGDGRIVIAAVKIPGVRGVCVDIDPERVHESRLNAQAAGVAERIRFVEGDLFKVPIADATVVTLFLLPDVNLRLRPRLLSELRPGTRVVSYLFDMGDWKPEREAPVEVPPYQHVVYRWVVPERPDPERPDRQGLFRRRSQEAESRGLAEPFRGVTVDGTVITGLFAIRSTGISTEPVRTAALRFLAALSPAQRAKTLFAVGDDEWRKWMNQHFYVRQGTAFRDMSAPQREAAFALMQASLSARGLRLSRDIMRLNTTLAELNHDNFAEYGEWLYSITVMGEPSATEPWGWQLDGHHLIVNYFVLGDQVVMTPSFFGSEPVVARAGKYEGTAVLQDEQRLGLALLRSLSPPQRKEAVLSVSKTGNNNLAEAFQDNLVLGFAGLRASGMSADQKRQLLSLIGQYVGNMDDGHAQVKMDEVRAHLDDTWFAWMGGTEDASVFYYRIHSPVILIEFDHQLPVATRQRAADPRRPDRDHVHTVVRTPNGNDYGKDLLRQHYERHPHPH
jgi:SAM-dependent methyltransferase